MSENYLNLVESVISFYDVGKLITANFEEIQDRENNLILKFETNMGTYLLKCYSDIKNKGKTEDLKQRLSYAAGLLIQDQIPIPLCLTKKKAPYLEFNGELFSIDRFIEGTTFKEKRDDESLILVANLLGKLHSSTRIEIKKPLKTHEFVKTKNTLRIFESFEKIKEENSKESLEVLSYEKIILSELSDLERAIKKLKPKKKISLIHGSYAERQIMINDINMAYLIDYETMEQNFSEYEFSNALLLFSKGDNFKFDLDLANLFIKSYKNEFGEEFEINVDEILTLIRHSLLNTFSGILRTYSKTFRPELNQGPLNFFFNKLKWLRENENLVREKLII